MYLLFSNTLLLQAITPALCAWSSLGPGKHHDTMLMLVTDKQNPFCLVKHTSSYCCTTK